MKKEKESGKRIKKRLLRLLQREVKEAKELHHQREKYLRRRQWLMRRRQRHRR
jgi:hypothetical protein